MGDFSYPPGTYYVNQSKLHSPMWYMLDQVIMSKDVLPLFRIEFSNAGTPLVVIERIVDFVPVSRNENIAVCINVVFVKKETAVTRR